MRHILTIYVILNRYIMAVAKNFFVSTAAFISIVLLFVARHHPPSRRKIKEIWHGRVSWEGKSNTTMLRSSPEKVLTTNLDSELAEDATVVQQPEVVQPQNPTTPTTPAMAHPVINKTALLFLSTGRLRYWPVWKRWLAGHDDKVDVFVHSTNTFTTAVPDTVHIVPSPIQARRFSYTMAQAMVHMLRYAQQRYEYRHFVFLSESCLPIQSFVSVRAVLTEFGDRSLFSINKALELGASKSEAVVFTRNNLSRYGVIIDDTAKPKQTVDGLRPFYASQWQIVSQRDAKTVLQKFPLQLNAYLNGKINRIWLTDATAIQSLIMSDDREVGFFPLWAQIWKGDHPGHGSRPKTFSMDEEARQFIQKGHSKGFLFARKFSINAVTVANILQTMHILLPERI